MGNVLMESAYGKFATWLTGKTETSELLVMGRYGIASFKVVSSANGKKVQVFSGFDVATWVWSDVGGSSNLALWEHRYVEAQEKAATKWGSKVNDIPYGEVIAVLDKLDPELQRALRNAIAHDPKVKSHWHMICGTQTPVASSGKAKATDVKSSAPEPRTSKPTADQIFRERMAADEGWGVF